MDGKPYPPQTLYIIICGIQRYLKNECFIPNADILRTSNHSFIATRATLDSRMKELTEMGLNVVKGSDTVTPKDEGILLLLLLLLK